MMRDAGFRFASQGIPLVIAASFLGGGGCADGAQDRTGEEISRTHQSVRVVTSPTCTVEWTKIDYKAPAGEEFIELKVTKSSALVETLGDCGLGGLNLYAHSATCTLPYRIIPLQNISIEGQYVVICKDKIAGVNCDVQLNEENWLRDTPTELGFFAASTAGGGSAVPVLWAQYGTNDAEPFCVPPLVDPPVHRVQNESAATPTTGNAWCPPDSASGAFVVLSRASMQPRQSYTCPAGAGGAGGGSATGGSAGTSAGGTSAGGTSAGGTSAGGTSAGGTSAGGTSAGGTSAGGTTSGGTSAGGTSAGGTSAGGTSTGGTSAGGTATGGTAAGGSAASTSGGTTGTGRGGAAANAGALGLEDIAIEGGGCTCSTSPQGHGFGSLALALALPMLRSLRRRRAARASKSR